MTQAYTATPDAITVQYNVPEGWNPDWPWGSSDAPHPPGYPPGDPTGDIEAGGAVPAVHSFIFTVEQSGQEIGGGYKVGTHVNAQASYIPPPIDGIKVGYYHETYWRLTDYDHGDGVSQFTADPATKNRGYAFRVYIEMQNSGSFTVDAVLQHYKDGELVGTYSSSSDYETPFDGFGTHLESFELAHIVIDGEQAVASSLFEVEV